MLHNKSIADLNDVPRENINPHAAFTVPTSELIACINAQETPQETRLHDGSTVYFHPFRLKCPVTETTYKPSLYDLLRTYAAPIFQEYGVDVAISG